MAEKFIPIDVNDLTEQELLIKDKVQKVTEQIKCVRKDTRVRKIRDRII